MQDTAKKEEEDESVPAPQVTIGADGEIILNEARFEITAYSQLSIKQAPTSGTRSVHSRRLNVRITALNCIIKIYFRIAKG